MTVPGPEGVYLAYILLYIAISNPSNYPSYFTCSRHNNNVENLQLGIDSRRLEGMLTGIIQSICLIFTGFYIETMLILQNEH